MTLKPPWQLAARVWRLYVKQPKETKQYLHTKQLQILATRLDCVTTAAQPKQVTVSEKQKLAIVSGMQGHKLQFFDYAQTPMKLVHEIPFEDQCVETEISGSTCFVTTSNFKRFGNRKNHLHIIDLATFKERSRVVTGGNWSKVIALHPSEKLAFISNWQTNDISIIDISNLDHPRLLQIIPCGDSPRGIGITKSGTVLVTGFYSGNITKLQKGRAGRFKIVHVGKRFDYPRYSGNMRDIIISPDDQTAYISNVGRNLLHAWSIKDQRFVKSISVGKEPNSVTFDDTKKKILISCRKSNAIYIVDTESMKVAGRSEHTGSLPTGLCKIKGGFLTTGFLSNTLERFISPREKTIPVAERLRPKTKSFRMKSRPNDVPPFS